MTRTPVPILRGRIENGKFVWAGLDAKRWEAQRRFLEGKEVEVTIQRLRKRRSLNQNAYMWGVVVAMIAEAAGYEPEEAHDALKIRFLTIHGDTALPTVRSTTDLTTTEFEEYLSKCRQLGAEMYGIYIPEPNEVSQS